MVLLGKTLHPGKIFHWSGYQLLCVIRLEVWRHQPAGGHADLPLLIAAAAASAAGSGLWTSSGSRNSPQRAHNTMVHGTAYRSAMLKNDLAWTVPYSQQWQGWCCGLADRLPPSPHRSPGPPIQVERYWHTEVHPTRREWHGERPGTAGDTCAANRSARVSPPSAREQHCPGLHHFLQPHPHSCLPAVVRILKTVKLQLNISNINAVSPYVSTYSIYG